MQTVKSRKGFSNTGANIMPQLNPQNQAPILGLSQKPDNDIWLQSNRVQGEIYIVLDEETATKDEEFSRIQFTANISLDGQDDDYIDGYRYQHADVWIADIYGLKWQILDVEAPEYNNIFEPTDSQKDEIADIIKEFIFAQEISTH